MKQWIRYATWITLVLTLAACSEPEPSTEATPSPESSTTKNNITLEEQLPSYYKDFPYQDTYDYFAKYTKKDPSNINQWVLGIEPELVAAGEDTVVRMNNDTYYKMSFIHLKNGPVILSSSKMDEARFSSFQLMDDHNVNFKNVIRPKGAFTLYYDEAPQNYTGELIQAPSELMVVIVRVEVKDKNNDADTESAKEIFNGIAIQGPQYTQFPQVDLLSKYDQSVKQEANKRMDEVFSTTPFSKLIAGPGYVPDRVSYLQLAAGTKGGWGGPVTSHSAYEVIFHDAQGNDLDGSKGAYTVTTTEPLVKAFWSVTVYDTERGGFLHPNKHNRYHINNTTAQVNKDDTVSFNFKQSCHDADKNCLEVPANRFDLALRYYLPDESIQSSEWTFPKLNLQ
jgi:hypothetical protein